MRIAQSLLLITSSILSLYVHSNCTVSELTTRPNPYESTYFVRVMTECNVESLMEHDLYGGGSPFVVYQTLTKDRLRLTKLRSANHVELGDVYYDAVDWRGYANTLTTHLYNGDEKIKAYFRNKITHVTVGQEWELTGPSYSDTMSGVVTLHELNSEELRLGRYQLCYKAYGFHGYATAWRENSASMRPFRSSLKSYEGVNISSDSVSEMSELHQYEGTNIPDATRRAQNGYMTETAPRCEDFTLNTVTPQISVLDYEGGSVDAPIETNGRFRVQLVTSLDDFEELAELKLFKSTNGGVDWIEHSTINGEYQTPSQFVTVLLNNEGSSQYRVQSCVGGLCTNSNVISITYEPTPTAPEVITRNTQITKVEGELLSWNASTFPSNSTSPQYKISWNKFNIQDIESPVLVESGLLEDIPVGSTELALDFVENGYGYNFSIQACNFSCSSGVTFTDADDESLFVVGYTPDGPSSVDVLNEYDEPLFGASTTGNFKFRLTSINAAKFKIFSSSTQLLGSSYNDIYEDGMVPVAIDPVLLVPVEMFEGTELLEEYYSSIGLAPIEVEKPVGQSSIVYALSEELNGEYTYVIYACSIYDDCLVVNDNLKVVVDIPVAIPDQVIFDGSDLSLGGDYSDEEKNLIDKIYLRDADGRIVHEVTFGVGGFDSALASLNTYLPSNARGYSVTLCGVLGCSDPIVLVVAPDAPSFINVVASDRSLGYGQVATWGNVEGAESYTLIQRVETYDFETDQTIISEVEISGLTQNSYTFDAQIPRFGQHYYKVRSENVAGTSNYTNEVTLRMESDPTALIRSLLYYAHEDDLGDIIAGEIEPTDPVSGIYNRENAAFRYLDLMYTESHGGVVLIDGNGDISIGSGITDNSGQILYGNEEREKALRAEVRVKELLGSVEYADNSNVQKLLLDIYFDRATAEMYLANLWLDRAKVLRFTNQQDPNSLDDEIEFISNARDRFEDVLFGCTGTLGQTCFTPGYDSLFDDVVFSEYLNDYTPTRGQISPRYWQPGSGMAQKVVSDPNLLASGYKDVRLMYEIMAGYLESSVEAAKLKVIAGGANLVGIDIDISDLREAKNSLSQIDERLYDTYGSGFSSVDWNGLDEARSRYINAYTKVENAVNWLLGVSNYLGVPNDLVILRHDAGNPTNDSFDNYISNIQSPYSAYSRVSGAINQAISHYDTFRANNDTASTHRENYIATWAGHLLELTGFNCSEIDVRAENEQCYKEGDGWIVSEISLQAQALELAIGNVERAEAQLEALNGTIQNKINELFTFRELQGEIGDVILDYGERQIDFDERINKISIDAQRRQARNSSRLGLSDIINAGISSGGQPALAVANLAGSMHDKNQAYQTAKIGIAASARIGQLNVMSAELELERQMRIHNLTGAVQEASFVNQIENMWLEANLQALNIEQAHLNVETEADKLTILFNKAQYALDKIISNSEELQNRYFADPVHARRVTSYMDQAYDLFEKAQLELYLAANALEYRLGVDLNAGALTFKKSDIFKARTLDDLSEFLTEMIMLSQNGVSSNSANATISFKKDILGYTRVIREGQELAIYEDPLGSTNYLNADQAFRNRISHSYQVFDSYLVAGDLAGYEASHSPNDPIKFQQLGSDIYMKIKFSTENGIYRSSGARLFNGVLPSFTASKDDTCYISAGTYRDKIEKTALLMTVSSQRADVTELDSIMHYGGVGYYRPKNPPPLDFYKQPGGDAVLVTGAAYQEQLEIYKAASQLYFDDISGQLPADESDLVGHLEDYLLQLDRLNELSQVHDGNQDIIPFDIRYWDYNFSTDKFEESAQQAHSISTKVASSSTTDMTDYYTNHLKERSVAVSDWVFSFPISTSAEGDLIFLDQIQDIELLIDYTYVDRSISNGDACSPF